MLYFQKVNELKEEVDKILQVCFDKDLELKKAVDLGFSNFLNSFDNAPNFLAQYCDNFLHKDSSKGNNE